jgi:hypothetical protein
VSASPPGPRSSSFAPTWRSSAATCWETAGWVSARASAARENEPSRADLAEGEHATRIDRHTHSYGSTEMMI